jgi:hypothetical protein
MLSKLLPTAAQGSSRAKSGRSGDFAMVSDGYDGVDGPWNLSNAVQVSEPKKPNLDKSADFCGSIAMIVKGL